MRFTGLPSLAVRQAHHELGKKAQLALSRGRPCAPSLSRDEFTQPVQRLVLPKVGPPIARLPHIMLQFAHIKTERNKREESKRRGWTRLKSRLS